MEIWKTIPEAPKYEVSTLGRVRHITSAVIKKATVANGYSVVCLYLGTTLDGKKKTITPFIQRLVATAFLPPPNHPHPVIRHRNDRLDDCRAVNLQWALHPKLISWDDGKPVLGEWRYPFADYEET